MKKIDKMSSPEWFEKWKLDFIDKEKRSPEYEEMKDYERRRLRSQLIVEQGKICCYCMRRINVNDSHIEHFRPRSMFPEDEMNYDNMFASCTGQENDIIYSKWHCDPKKNDWYDSRIPELTSEEIEKCLKYSMDGKVIPYHDKRHDRYEFENLLIEKLGLNAPFLVRNRKQAIEKSELFDEAEYSVSDWMELIRYYDEMHNGEYEEYCMMFVVLMNGMIEG